MRPKLSVVSFTVVHMIKDLDRVGEADIVSAAAACVQAEIRAGCELLEWAAHWATVHPGEGLTFDERIEKYGERNVMIAGDGTPDVAEFAIGDFALEIRQSIPQTRMLIADALDLRHRLPLTWREVQHARVPARVARRLARQTRRLSREQAMIIDRRVYADLANLSITRLDNRIEAEILRVDRDEAEREAEAANRSRHFRVGRPKPSGLCDVWARMPAPEARQADSAVDRLADILIDRRDDLPAVVPARNARSRDEWRSVAAAILLNNPVLAARFLVEDQQPHLFHDSDQPSDQPDDQPDDDAAVIDLITRIDPTKLAPTAVLHVHIDAEAFRCGDMLARVEDIGPTLLSTVRSWLGEACRVRLQPIVDSPGIASVDRYEISPRMREAVFTRTPGSVFPWSGSLNRRNQLDHTVPYRRHGPPGQTGLHNLGPLTVAEHRHKTFARAEVRQPVPGTVVWRTRFGRVLMTNFSGTHDLGVDDFAQSVWAAAVAGELTLAS